MYVVDYDASRDTLYKPACIPVPDRPADELATDPAFHAQNVYAIVMRTLSRFEHTLGRKVAWSFDGHQLHVAPHAFEDANAFYAKRDRALYFGYFTGEGRKRVFTCLSYDVIAHETTHAILDGLRERYTFPSSPDQAAFHEGFADAVALLSIFSLSGVVQCLLEEAFKKGPWINRKSLTLERLRKTALFALGESLDPRSEGLRRSADLPANPTILEEPEFLEPHRRGEVLVAALMQAFLRIWLVRIAGLSAEPNARLYHAKVAEEGQAAADHLLTMSIRALDYAPATDIQFGDYLSALLTADMEVQPDDSKYSYRDCLKESFAAYGVTPASQRRKAGDAGVWEGPGVDLDYRRLHLEALRQDPDEVFRFLWQNRAALGLCDEAYTRVHSLRPCIRVSSDGAILRETVAEYHQILNVFARELAGFGLGSPRGMPSWTRTTLYGGGALIFDEFGQLKYHVRNRVLGKTRQDRRLKYLWDSGYYSQSHDERRLPPCTD